MTTTEFEFIVRSDSPCPSIVKMWVLLEGSPSPLKLKADITKVQDLNDFKEILSHEYEELMNVRPQNIVFLDSYNTQLPPGTNLKTLAETATDVKPLVVRYPISPVNLKVTFAYGTHGQRLGKREIPHSSGSFSLLKLLAREIFPELEEEEIYFVNNGTDIWDTYNFNNVISDAQVDNNNVTLKLTVKMKGRKKYSDWKLSDVFKEILRQPTYGSLADLPNFDMKEYAPLNPPFTDDELKDFVTQLNNQLFSFRREFGNETKNRAYINAFMSHAVCYIRKHVNPDVMLDVERLLSGSKGYGPIDYWVIFINILLLLCEAKSEDMNQGVAQVIVQMQSAIERLSKQKQDQVIYGIASTGKLWRFVRWDGSLENPEVHISEEYTCSFEGNMETEKKVLVYIAQILKAQVDDKSERPPKRVKVELK